MNDIPDKLVEILRKEQLSTIKDLKYLTEDDVRDLGLPLGYKNRLRNALKMLHEDDQLDERRHNRKPLLKRMCLA